MSKAVICDRCGKVVKLDDATRIDALYIGTRGKVSPIYGADLCKECRHIAKFENGGMVLFATVPAMGESEVNDASENNALAELSHRLNPDMVTNDDLDMAQRIIAELAKVKLNGVGWPVRIELADAYENCRAIAEEGAKDGE